MSRKIRWTLAAAAAMATVVVAGLVAWPMASAWQASKVHLTTAQLVQCRDPESVVDPADRLHAEDEPWDRSDPVISLYNDRRLDCILRTTLVNDSSADVELESVTWGFFGPGAGAGLLASWPDGGGPELDSAEHDDGARFDLSGYGLALAGDTPIVLPIRVTHRPGACGDRGSEFSAPDSPTVTIRVLGRRHEITAWGESVAFTDTADCGTVASEES